MERDAFNHVRHVCKDSLLVLYLGSSYYAHPGPHKRVQSMRGLSLQSILYAWCRIETASLEER